LRVDAREEGYRLRFMKTKETQEEIYDARLGVGSGSLCTKDLETLRIRKANIVTDALSRKESLRPSRVRALGMIVQTSLKSHIIKARNKALKEENLEAEKLYNVYQKFEVWSDGVRYLKGRAWIPRIDNLRDVILDEAHRWRYLIHPGANKMYQDVKEYYWWHGMKKDIELYVRKCLTCAKVKAEYQKPSGLLQQPKILVWK
ncbi:putative reverse transcriptase domain-containing protein, partial [Tanacetum coccineum]